MGIADYGQHPADDGKEHGLPERQADVIEPPDGSTTVGQPSADRQERHAERQQRDEQRQGQTRQCGAAEPGARDRAGGARADPRIALVAAQDDFHRQQHETTGHQHAGQHVGRRPVEGRLELIDDRRRERVEADEDVEAVFGEKVQPHQQRTAADGQPELGQHDAHEHAPWRIAQRGRSILQRRVEPAQRRRDRQIGNGK